MSVSRALPVLPWARRAPERLTNIIFVTIVVSVGGGQSYHCPHFVDGENEVNDLIRNDPTERSMSLCKDTQPVRGRDRIRTRRSSPPRLPPFPAPNQGQQPTPRSTAFPEFTCELRELPRSNAFPPQDNTTNWVWLLHQPWKGPSSFKSQHGRPRTSTASRIRVPAGGGWPAGLISRWAHPGPPRVTTRHLPCRGRRRTRPASDPSKPRPTR